GVFGVVADRFDEPGGCGRFGVGGQAGVQHAESGGAGELQLQVVVLGCSASCGEQLVEVGGFDADAHAGSGGEGQLCPPGRGLGGDFGVVAERAGQFGRPLVGGLGAAFELGAHGDGPVGGGVHFDAGRHGLRAADGVGDAGCFGGGVGGGGDPAVFGGQGVEPEDRFGDDAEGAEGAGVDLA